MPVPGVLVYGQRDIVPAEAVPGRRQPGCVLGPVPGDRAHHVDEDVAHQRRARLLYRDLYWAQGVRHAQHGAADGVTSAAAGGNRDTSTNSTARGPPWRRLRDAADHHRAVNEGGPHPRRCPHGLPLCLSIYLSLVQSTSTSSTFSFSISFNFSLYLRPQQCAVRLTFSVDSSPRPISSVCTPYTRYSVDVTRVACRCKSLYRNRLRWPSSDISFWPTQSV